MIRKITWSELEKHDCETLQLYPQRLPEVEELYTARKLQMNLRGSSVDADILRRLRDDFTLELNKYPYHTDEDITHYVFWMTFEKISMREAKEKITRLLGKSPNEIIINETPNDYKSIKSINHYQVFVLNR